MDSRPVWGHPRFVGRVGVAREDITPPVGIYARSWGAATHDVAAGIHRPLTATVLTFQSETNDAPLVLAALDLGWWRTAEDERFVRDALRAALDLPEENALVCLSHTHAGPSTCREEADKPGGHLIAAYRERVRDALTAAATRALAAAVPAEVTTTEGRCALARVRDQIDPDDPARVVVGFAPDAPAPDRLVVGRVAAREDGGGRVLATFVHYACHPVSLAHENQRISPDYVGAMREVVEAATGGAPCLFLQGASGELAPRRQYAGDPAVADANGRVVGYAALSALEEMLPPFTRWKYDGALESGARLGLWRSAPAEEGEAAGRLAVRLLRVPLALKPDLTAAEIETRLADPATDRTERERLSRRLRIRRALGDDASETRMPVWLWRLGDIALAAHPNEAYSALQAALPGVLVINCANGPYCGYLPPADLYGRDDRYTVWQTPLAAGCLERVRDALLAAGV
jgi:Neutral/alkaline non-lysosomal ceramidase.